MEEKDIIAWQLRIIAGQIAWMDEKEFAKVKEIAEIHFPEYRPSKGAVETADNTEIELKINDKWNHETMKALERNMYIQLKLEL